MFINPVFLLFKISFTLQDWLVMGKVTNTKTKVKKGLTPKKKLSNKSEDHQIPWDMSG